MTLKCMYQLFHPWVSAMDSTLSLNLDMSIVANRDISEKSRTKQQTVWIPMRWLNLSSLILIYTVCISPRHMTWCFIQSHYTGIKLTISESYLYFLNAERQADKQLVTFLKSLLWLCQEQNPQPSSHKADTLPVEPLHCHYRRICLLGTNSTDICVIFLSLALVLLNLDMLCLCKQCRSRSVDFWRGQLIWICTVCH